MTPFAGNNRSTSLWRTSDRPDHMGLDISTDGALYTEPWMVRETTGGGTVIEASVGYNYGRGNLVRVQYPQHNNCVACYQHLERIDVQVGQQVEQGHRLGLAGETGDSQGVHLHFEVRTAPGEGGQDIDPSPWCGVPNAYGNHPGNNNLDNPAPEPAPAPTDTLAGFSDEQLADRVIAGEFGNGDDRKNALGSRWGAVQAIVDARMSQAPAQRTHTVVSGDNLWNLAQQYGVDWNAMLAANAHFADPNLIYPGDTVYIP